MSKSGTLERTQTRRRDNLSVKHEERIREGVKLWTSFYRKNPARFFQDYFGLKLHPFQVYMFNMIDRSTGSAWITTRGLGKSFTIAGYLVTRAVLYPNSKIVVSCETVDQASQLVREKIETEMMGRSSNLKREIVGIKTGDKGIKVVFKNNSFIEAINADENTRGRRANVLCVDEYVQIKGGFKTIDKILRPFLQVPRYAPYLEKKEYKHLKESNKQIFMTSGWYSGHWSYDLYTDYREKMLRGDNFYAGNFSYHLGRYHSLVSDERLEEIEGYKKNDQATYIMEYGGQFYKLNDDAYISPNNIMSIRDTIKAWYPPTDIEYVENKNKPKDKKTYYLPRKKGEKRVLSCDIALMDSGGGKNNDASVYTYFSCTPKDDKYISNVLHQETWEGKSANYQALQIKRLFYDGDCDYIVLDCLNAGVSVLDALGEHTFDKDRDVTYPPMKCFNSKDLEKRCGYKDALPVIFGIRATGELNGEIAITFKTAIENKSLKMLVNEREAEDYLTQHRKFKELDASHQVKLLNPYLQTTLMQNEIVTLKAELASNGKYIKLIETGRSRKDRYSSCSYGLYFIKTELERELKKPKKKGNFIALW